jgi:hypothetical protein
MFLHCYVIFQTLVKCEYQVWSPTHFLNISLSTLIYSEVLILIVLPAILVEGWTVGVSHIILNKGNNKITELRTILQRESQNS